MHAESIRNGKSVPITPCDKMAPIVTLLMPVVTLKWWEKSEYWSNGLLVKISLNISNASWHLSDYLYG